METVPERLRDFAAVRLDVLIECECGAYRYSRADALGWTLEFLGGTDWFYNSGRLLKCEFCGLYGKTAVTPVRRLSHSEWHSLL